ncbi:uncharacterized protein CELE_K08C9.6 [Caenorhabditis elegans]|uniref:Secreted protein n=1 Tax=Caenorhabditis elegans TaxID=6239 RepID=G5EGJ2_CAEEL|nr:Secreted protein [Caenorhabditis elegans]CAB04589.2 Secreted protein [Caenorhabditis elegans]|eukprot:NP_492938.2 Uncharacterized protein CELE_K08C9.6 [Caenorhabditis elegans]
MRLILAFLLVFSFLQTVDADIFEEIKNIWNSVIDFIDPPENFYIDTKYDLDCKLITCLKTYYEMYSDWFQDRARNFCREENMNHTPQPNNAYDGFLPWIYGCKDRDLDGFLLPGINENYWGFYGIFERAITGMYKISLYF